MRADARPSDPSSPTVLPFPTVGDDASLALRARRGDPSAIAAIYDRHAGHVRRVIARVLGVDAELADCLQETFARAIEGLARLEDPAKLRAWLTSLAVLTSREWIRRRRRRRWLAFFAPEDVPETSTRDASPETREAVRRTYAILDKLPEDERVAFALRVIDEMELAEAADAAGMSLATFKRRLSRAEERFRALAERDPVLRDLLPSPEVRR